MKNKTLINISKGLLLHMLIQCTDDQQLMFKKMYCYSHLEYSIEQAVNVMNPDAIDHAFTQIENTLEKNEIKRQNKIN